MRNLHNIFCPTSPFAAGPQGKLLVIKVLLLIEHQSKALTLTCGGAVGGQRFGIGAGQLARLRFWDMRKKKMEDTKKYIISSFTVSLYRLSYAPTLFSS